jgi:hypothetical protein
MRPLKYALLAKARSLYKIILVCNGNKVSPHKLQSSLDARVTAALFRRDIPSRKTDQLKLFQPLYDLLTAGLVHYDNLERHIAPLAIRDKLSSSIGRPKVGMTMEITFKISQGFTSFKRLRYAAMNKPLT